MDCAADPGAVPPHEFLKGKRVLSIRALTRCGLDSLALMEPLGPSIRRVGRSH